MGLLDKLMGRGKKAAGDLTGDSSMRREGMHQEQEGLAEERASSHEEMAAEERAKAAEHRVEKNDEAGPGSAV
ncbi:MAG TPA: CsbD family protein [Gaiellaceae bacterium]|jgi:uncharacterized protein YjbJ (UPF0337 family)|nr:CsbD family protein [Gaiellaceae bacterium]